MNSFRYDLALARMQRQGEVWLNLRAARLPTNDVELKEAQRVFRRETERERKRRKRQRMTTGVPSGTRS